ncbi:hypothetical protein TNCV_1447941 [Trichonephila clavipes]|nr:hypothetical protein TNCV_1447941 [Trichonephila clavipes]
MVLKRVFNVLIVSENKALVDENTEHSLEGAGNAATSELMREMGNQRADSRRGSRRSGVEKKEQREQWPSRDPLHVVHKRDA